MHFHLRLGSFTLLFWALAFIALGQSRVHKVKRGDTLYSLSRQYDTTVDELLRLNPRISAQSMPVGYALKVPGTSPPPEPSPSQSSEGTASARQPSPSTTDRDIPTKLQQLNYRVKQDETLASIGQRFAIPQQRLRELNPDVQGELKPGQVIVLEMLMFDEKAAKEKRREATAQKEEERKSAGQEAERPIGDANAEELALDSSKKNKAPEEKEGNRTKPEDQEVTPIDDEELDIYDNPIYRPAPAGYERILIVHGIKPGESLQEIADQYDATKGQLIAWNDEKAQDPLVVGETLIVKIEDIPVAGEGELPDEITTVKGEDGKSVLADGRVVEDGVDNIMNEGKATSESSESTSGSSESKASDNEQKTSKKEEQPKKEEKKEANKDDGPNISRARASDVIYTGKGLGEEEEPKEGQDSGSADKRASDEKPSDSKKEEAAEEEEAKKDDGPNISRARVSDVVHTGKGIKKDQKSKTLEETLKENEERYQQRHSQEMTGLPEGHAGSVQGTGREPSEPSPYGEYIAWHDEARVGSYVKLTNPNSGESVFAKVIGKVKNKSVAVECAPKVCQQLGIPLDQAVPLIVEYND